MQLYKEVMKQLAELLKPCFIVIVLLQATLEIKHLQDHRRDKIFVKLYSKAEKIVAEHDL